MYKKEKNIPDNLILFLNLKNDDVVNDYKLYFTVYI